MRPILLLAVLATVSFAPLAHAAPSRPAKPAAKPADDALPTGPKAYVGAWSVGKDGEGADVCTVRFNAAGVIGGFQLVAPKACKDAVPRWEDLYAWRVGQNGDIVMADATRRSVYVFHKLDDDVWATEGGDWERLLLQKARTSR
jgi:hypothetical protein